MFPNIERLANFSFCGVSPLDQNNPSSLALSPITLFMSFPWVRWGTILISDLQGQKYFEVLSGSWVKPGPKFNQGWVEISRQEKRGQGFKFWRITWTKLHVHKMGTHLSNPVSLPSFSPLIFHTNQLPSLNSLKHLPCFSLTLMKFEVFPFYHILGLGPRQPAVNVSTPCPLPSGNRSWTLVSWSCGLCCTLNLHTEL